MSRVTLLGLVVFVMSLLAFGVPAQPMVDDLAIQRLPSRGKLHARIMVDRLRPYVKEYAKTHSLVAQDYPFETYRGSPHARVSYSIFF